MIGRKYLASVRVWPDGKISAQRHLALAWTSQSPRRGRDNRGPAGPDRAPSPWRQKMKVGISGELETIQQHDGQSRSISPKVNGTLLLTDSTPR